MPVKDKEVEHKNKNKKEKDKEKENDVLEHNPATTLEDEDEDYSWADAESQFDYDAEEAAETEEYNASKRALLDSIDSPPLAKSSPIKTIAPDVLNTLKYNQNIEYAPAVKPVTGTYNLLIASIGWTDKTAISLDRVLYSGKEVASVYSKISRDNITFKPYTKKVNVPYKAERSNLKNAEAIARKELNTIKRNPLYGDLYILVNNGVSGVSHGSGNTVHARGVLIRDLLHEVGHCRPFVMQHSGIKEPNGKVDAYGDGTSFMGRMNTRHLTAAQIYGQGWYPIRKVGLYTGIDPVEYEIEQLDSPDKEDLEALKAVMIPRDGKDPLFLSMPKVGSDPKKSGYVLMLHEARSNCKGTTRVKSFSAEAAYDDLSFEVIEKSEKSRVVRVRRNSISAPTP